MRRLTTMPAHYLLPTLLTVLLASSCSNDVTYPSAGPFIPSSYGVPDGEDIRRFDDTTDVRAIIRIKRSTSNIIDLLSNNVVGFSETSVLQQFHDGTGSARDLRFLVANGEAPFGTYDVSITRPYDTVFGQVDQTIRPEPEIRLANVTVGDTVDRNTDLVLEFNEPGSRWINLQLVRDLSDPKDNSPLEFHRRHYDAASRIILSRHDLSLLPRGWITLTYGKHQVVFLETEYQRRVALVFHTEQIVSLYLR